MFDQICGGSCKCGRQAQSGNHPGIAMLLNGTTCFQRASTLRRGQAKSRKTEGSHSGTDRIDCGFREIVTKDCFDRCDTVAVVDLSRANTMNSIRVIFPYRRSGVWMFDDDAVGLKQEPFVFGIPEMIESVVGGIHQADVGFALYFSDNPFPGFQVKLDWIREEYDGNWYRLCGTGKEGWLCPALLKYFDRAPATIYARAEGATRR
jgi:hypothetical protein